MSKSARRRANQEAEQVARYWPAVFAALASDDITHVDPAQFRALPCPVCGALLLGACDHAMDRAVRRFRETW